MSLEGMPGSERSRSPSSSSDLQVQSIAHGALLLEDTIPAFGPPRRRLSVTKYRGCGFRGGYHDYAIRHGGLQVYPRLVAAEHRRESSQLQAVLASREAER